MNSNSWSLTDFLAVGVCSASLLSIAIDIHRLVEHLLK